MLKDLILVLLDSMRNGDFTGHLAAWLSVATGEITPETRYREAHHEKRAWTS